MCVGPVLYGDFEFFKVPLCVKLCPCTGEIEFLQKILVLGILPCAGEIGFFGSKILVLGIFPRWWSRKAVKKRCQILRIFCYRYMLLHGSDSSR